MFSTPSCLFAAALLVLSAVPNPGLMGVAAMDLKLMTCLVNDVRKKQDLPPLGIHKKLCKASEMQSKHQAKIKTMTHDGEGGSNVGQRVDESGYKWGTVAENVAYGYNDEVTVMYEWMCSPGHKKNLMCPKSTMFGSAIAKAGDVAYWTQVFASEHGVSSSDVPDCGDFQDQCKDLNDRLAKGCKKGTGG